MRRTLLFDGTSLSIRNQPLPNREPDEVFIRPLLMGICSTDLELMRGYQNFRGILGHEFVGEVITGPDEWKDQRVVGEINISCGTCDMCQQGLRSHCRNRSVLGISGGYGGAFADVFKLPIRNLHRVPEEVHNEQAVFTEPLAAACEILEQVHIKPQQRIAVVGVGKLGMLVAQVLHSAGAFVTGVTRHEFQNNLLKRWGITSSRIDEMTSQTYDMVVECTGNPEGFSAAVNLVRPRGTIVLKSTYFGLPEADLTTAVVNEVTMVGSRCGPFDVALNFLKTNRVDVQPLIEASYDLDHYTHAFDHAAQRGTLKVLLER